MTNERRKELLKVVLMQIDKGNRVPSAVLACSSDSEERKHITRAIEACIPVISDGGRAAKSLFDYDRMISDSKVRATWVRRSLKRAQTAIHKEQELANLR